MFLKKMSKTLVVFFILSNITIKSQENHPQNYFSDPLETEKILNGNFGETRSAHFHSGIDFKTQFKEGLNVYSSAEGYVSRISIKHGGFGKALYINHPNGYTTVYAHLKNFSDKIESYIKKLQYGRKTFQIEHYPNKNALPILKKEKIGSSGNTGSSFGPHLHYEIRKTSNQKPLNPQLFNFNIKDSRKPTLSSVFLYKIDSLFQVSNPMKIRVSKINDSTYLSEKVFAKGKIGFGISGYDRQDLANNRNGIYKYQTYYNNRKYIEFKFDSFFFEESIKIKTLIDYKYYVKNKKRIIKLFIDQGNDLSIYSENVDKGYLDVKNRFSDFVIKLSDLKNNNLYIKIPIEYGEFTKTISYDYNEELNKSIDNQLEHNFRFENSNIKIPRNTFLKDVNLKLSSSQDSLKIFNPHVPVFKNISLEFKNTFDEKGNYLAYKDQNNNESFASSNLNKNNFFVLKTKSLGTYFIKKDTIPPKISLHNFKDGEWITSKKNIKLKILDDETGIKNYNVWINGKWMLFEYEYKKNQLEYNFDSYFENKVQNEIIIKIEDMVGNITEKKFNFYRK